MTRLRVGVVLGLLAAVAPVCGRGQQSAVGAAPYMNPALPVEQRVDDLIGRMTLAEKVGQMQNSAPAIERLGVPRYDWWNEGLHGVAFSGTATNFPAGDWDGGDVGHESGAPHGADDLDRGAGEVQPGGAR
jgi:beta-glucosidase